MSEKIQTRKIYYEYPDFINVRLIGSGSFESVARLARANLKNSNNVELRH